MEQKNNSKSVGQNLTQFEIVSISKFLRFEEIATFLQLSKKFLSIKSIIRADTPSNITRLKHLELPELIQQLRKALQIQLVEPSDLQYATILDKASSVQLLQKRGAMQRRIQRELKKCSQSEEIKYIALLELEKGSIFRFVFRGPENSVYREGIFTLQVIYPEEYPFKPFKVSFLSPICHPTVSMEGTFCSCCFDQHWSPAKNLEGWMRELFEGLQNPGQEFTHHACILDQSLRRECQDNFAQFQKKLIINTRKNAKFSLHTLLMPPLKD